nr:ATP-binding protein [uncultured Draconibacterium sp.]
MIVQVALIIAVVLQFIAFGITISLITKTRFNIAWISISVGFFLMALRRVMELIVTFSSPSEQNTSHLSSWIAVVISIAMLLAAVYIRKLFLLLDHLQKLREKNETRLLSAVISTEEKERKHFAKELHDGLGPVLSAAKMALSAMNKNELGKLNSQIVTKTEHSIKNAIVTTREISNHLNPQVLERYGIEKAINTFLKNIISAESPEFVLKSNMGELRFNHHFEVIIYRIACELINNTLKYANAKNAVLTIAAASDVVHFQYEDDGVGFDPENTEWKGMGLTNIRSRVKSLDGIIEINSQSNRGVSVDIKFPQQKAQILST